MSAFLLRFREPLSAANSAIVMLLLLLWFDALIPAPRRLPTSLPPIELTLVEPVVEPQIPPPVKPLLAQPSLKAERSAPRAVAQSVVPAATPTAAGDFPVAPSAQPTPPSQAAQSAPFAPPAVAVVAPALATPPPPINSGYAAEAVYVGKVRAYLQSIKRYPTGREASLQRPAGTAVIWFSVRRNGDLADAGIETSSGAMLLDNTALATVRRGNYPPFPDEAWAGKEQQRFTVELDFVPK